EDKTIYQSCEVSEVEVFMPANPGRGDPDVTSLADEAEEKPPNEVSLEHGAVILPPALRLVQLTAEEARRIKEILDEPHWSAQEGREMPSGDPDILLRKERLTAI